MRLVSNDILLTFVLEEDRMKKCLSVAVAVGLSGCVTSPADMPINPSDREFSQIYDVPNMSKGGLSEVDRGKL